MRTRTHLGVVSFALATSACASRATTPQTSELSTTAPTGLGWRSLDPSGPPQSDADLRAQLEDRRHELLDRCNEVLTSLEDRRREAGPIGTQVAAGVAESVASAMAPEVLDPTTGRPQQRPLPLNSGVGLTQTVSLRTRIQRLRTHLHELVVARTNGEMLDAMDRLAPDCPLTR